MRNALLALALLTPAALVGPLAVEAAACTLNPATTFTVSNPAIVTARVGAGTGSSGTCASADYALGYWFACPYDPLFIVVGGFVISIPPVTIIVGPLASVEQDSFVCDKRAVILP